jgi:hypothetical protein
MPYQSPNWTQNYLSGLTEISAPSAAPTSNVPFSPVPGLDMAQRNLLATQAGTAAPGGFMGALKGLGGWFGKNGQNIGNWANAIGQGVNAYIGLQQLGLAKDALKFEKKSFKTNLANQVDSYNTQMKDRITGRYYATEEERQAALKDAELPQGMRG